MGLHFSFGLPIHSGNLIKLLHQYYISRLIFLIVLSSLSVDV